MFKTHNSHPHLEFEIKKKERWFVTKKNFFKKPSRIKIHHYLLFLNDKPKT